MLDAIFSVLIGLLSNDQVQMAVLIAIFTFVAWLVKRWAWSKHVVGLAIEAYEYAENEGLLQKLKGYAKFDPFMNKFIARYIETYGRPPTAKAKGAAVQAMELKVAEDHLGK